MFVNSSCTIHRLDFLHVAICVLKTKAAVLQKAQNNYYMETQIDVCLPKNMNAEFVFFLADRAGTDVGVTQEHLGEKSM